MSVIADERYALGRSPEEYERLRVQARVWETATGRLLDHAGLGPGARCLDAGSGPGETMRLMAQRVGPAGQVTGIDIDAGLGMQAEAMLHEAGHRQCRVTTHDLSSDEPLPGAPFDLVFARLLLFHLPSRVAVLRRLWEAVAPGGHLLVQDYDLRTVSVTPMLPSVEAMGPLIEASFAAAGCDTRVGARLPELFIEAGIGEADGTDVAGRLVSFPEAAAMIEAVMRSLLPLAVARGITTVEAAEAALAAMRHDATVYPTRPGLWPLMIGAWKRRSG